MRLTIKQKQAIIQNFLQDFAGIDAELWLFGSKIDDNAKGGDIDLLIKCYQLEYGLLSDLVNKYSIHLQKQIGPRKIDIVLDYNPDLANREIIINATQSGILLWKNEKVMQKYSDLERLNNLWKLIQFHKNYILEVLDDFKEYDIDKINHQELIDLDSKKRAVIDSLMFRFMMIQDTLGIKCYL